MAEPPSATVRDDLHRKRWELLEHLRGLIDRPMTVLSAVWVALLVVDLTRGLGPGLALVSNGIWGLFIADFVLEFTVAPRKVEYLRRHWLTAVALLLPALRVLRLFRAFRVLRLTRAARSVKLLRVLTSVNRGLGAVRHAVAHRGFGYVALLSLLMLVAGAAGMYAFENPRALRAAGYAAGGHGLDSFGDALWWTAMMLTTMGSDYFPQSVEGRLLCWLLALYAFALFGYVTATVATYFVGQDRTAGLPPDHAAQLVELKALVVSLRDELAALRPREASPRSADWKRAM